jgi:hypothetical protein
MNRNLIAGVATIMVVTSTYADMTISGKYEGVAATSGGPATYTQDLDLTLKATVGDTTVKATLENLTGGETVKAKQLYITTKIEGLKFKAGTYKTQNGGGLLQKKTNASQMQISTKVSGVGIAVNQVSGDGNATFDTHSSIAGVNVKVQNVSNATRFITASTTIAGIDFYVETQAYTSTARNTAITASTSISVSETTSIGIAGVYLDVEDAKGVTQNDGIIGDVSDANSGTTVKAGIVTVDTTLGKVTGKYINKNDINTTEFKLKRGVMEYGYSKPDNGDATFDATLTIKF